MALREMGENEKKAMLKVLNGKHSRHYVPKLLSKGRDADAKSKALKSRTSPDHSAKDCGHKCVFHNKGVKHN